MSFAKSWIRGLVCFSLLCGASWGQSAAPPPQAAPAGPADAAAQVSTGGTKVHGTITDPDGELIPGATVTFTPSKGAGHAVKTGSDGTYAITLTPGTYTMLVSMPGFASYLMTNLKVPAVPSTTLDAKLKIGQESTVVNVEANAIQLSVDPDSNASSTVLQGKDLEALSDDPDELQSELQALAGPAAGPNGGQIYVDGFTGGQLPPKSSIREIRINQNPFSAEYDRLGYGRVEVFTKPGTDKLHGNLQVNGNPSQFNTSNPLTNTYQPPYHTVFMFGNLTGPLNKGASYNLGGSFRQIQDDAFTNAQILAPATGSATLCAPADPTCVQSTYQVSTYYPQTRVDINPRLDLALGEKNVLTTRYQFVRNTSTNAGLGNLTLPSAGYDTSTLSNIVQMSDTQTWSSKLINETRFEYEREHVATNALNDAPSLSVSGAFTAGGYTGQNLTDHQDHYEVQNYTSIQTKKNFIRMGGRLRATREAMDTEANTNGTFTYASLTPCVPSATTTCGADYSYQTGTPRQFSYTIVNNHKIGDTYADLGLYAETDWKPRSNLTVTYGLRYETQNHLADHHDFAPRVAANYGLFAKKGGAPKTVLRGGFGIFYDRFAQSNILTLEEENGVNETVYTVNNVPTGCTPTLNAPLTQTILNTCLSGAAATQQTTYTAAPTLRSPYTTQAAVGVDQQMSRFGTLSVNYIHSQGTHQLATQNINYNVAAQGPANPDLGPQLQFFSEGVFTQNQLMFNARVQTTRRVSLTGFYMINSAHGDASAGSPISTPGNIRADYGRTSFDVRQRLFLFGSISLPHFVQFSPFMIGQSGNPYNITTGSDNNNDSFFNDRPYLVQSGAAVPVTTGTSGSPAPVRSIAGCGTFAQPSSAPAGSAKVPINYCTGPALFTFNFRLTKTWGFGQSRNAAAADNGRGQRGGPGPGGPGGGPGGGGRHGGSGGGFFGGGSNTGRHYNVALGLQVQNLFGNKDLATPQGVLTSPYFGESTQLSGGPYTTNSATRRISLQASFNF